MVKKIFANGYEFSYIEKGSGKTLIFIHGSLLDCRYWKREIDFFSKQFRTISISRRHHWPTLPEGEFTYRAVDQTDDVIAFIDALGGSSVHLVGHSYGGYIAARIACLRPELLSSITLIEPGGPLEGGTVGRSRVADHNLAAELVGQGKKANGVAHFLDTVCFDPKWEDGSQTYQAMTLDNAITITQQVQETRPLLNAEALGKLQCPALLMIGERTISPFPETLARLKEIIPQSEYVEIKNASHMINIDNHEDFVQTLNTFLKLVAARD